MHGCPLVHITQATVCCAGPRMSAQYNVSHVIFLFTLQGKSNGTLCVCVCTAAWNATKQDSVVRGSFDS